MARWSFALVSGMLTIACATSEDPANQPYLPSEGEASGSTSGSPVSASGDDDATTGEEPPEGTAGPATGGPSPMSDTGTFPDDEGSTGAGSDDDEPDTLPDAQCSNQTSNITSMGWVEASSIFDPWFGQAFPAELSVDGNLGTSWFSAGPESDGAPTFFKWITQSDVCIGELQIIGNGGHNNADFRQGYGFGSLTVRIYDTGGDEVFRETYDLSGSPDPTVEVTTGGVQGHRVELYLDGHESDDCGGFSELTVYGDA